MPWTEQDVERHNKGLTSRQKRMWVHVANCALEGGDDDGTAIRKANGVVKGDHVEEELAAILYAKANDLVESVRLQVAASLLNEADPKPRVERDHKDKPIIPTKDDYVAYFQGMAAHFIHDQLNNAQERWKAAADDQAAREAIDHEIAAANEVLANHSDLQQEAAPPKVPSIPSALKPVKLTPAQKLDLQKKKDREKSILNIVHHVAGGLSGNSPIVTGLARFTAKKLIHHLSK